MNVIVVHVVGTEKEFVTDSSCGLCVGQAPREDVAVGRGIVGTGSSNDDADLVVVCHRDEHASTAVGVLVLDKNDIPNEKRIDGVID